MLRDKVGVEEEQKSRPFSYAFAPLFGVADQLTHFDLFWIPYRFDQPR